MDKYKKIEKVGEGAHGVVHKARVLKSTPDYWSSGRTDMQRGKRKKVAGKAEPDGDDVLPALESDDSKTAEFVAIKKIRVKDSTIGLSMDAVREIKLLQELHHPNIMKVRSLSLSLSLSFFLLSFIHSFSLSLSLSLSFFLSLTLPRSLFPSLSLPIPLF